MRQVNGDLLGILHRVLHGAVALGCREIPLVLFDPEVSQLGMPKEVRLRRVEVEFRVRIVGALASMRFLPSAALVLERHDGTMREKALDVSISRPGNP